MNKKPKEIQSFNWLFVGRQRTGKTAASLALIAELQFAAFQNSKSKRVLIFNPDNQNPVFEKKSLITEEVRHTIQAFKFPASLRKIRSSDIRKMASEKANLFDWCVVSEGSLTEFCDQAVKLRDFIIYFDDLNNQLRGSLAGKRFESFLEIFAGNRKRGNENIITYHSLNQVPNGLWTYFQRAIIKETDDKNEHFNKVGKAPDTFKEAQNQVRAENALKKNPEDLDLAERIIWLNNKYLFVRKGNDLITKIGKIYYKADGDTIVPI